MASEYFGLKKLIVVFVIPLLSGRMIAPVYSTKILFLPANVNSHMYYFSRLAVDLAHLGHFSHVLAPSNAHVPEFVQEATEVVGNFSYTTYTVDGDEPFANSRPMSESLAKMALTHSILEKLRVMAAVVKNFSDHCEADCVRLLENHNVMRQIYDGQYQFAVMDPVVPQCYYAIPYSLGIPYATYVIPMNAWVFRVPRLPSFSPSLGYTDRMSFTQRLATFLVETLIHIQMRNKSTAYIQRLVPGRPYTDAPDFLFRTSLWFYLEHVVVGYAQPQMPNSLAIGDIMAGRPGKALPHQFEKFLSASKDGAILVSFGSYLDYLPNHVLAKFCHAFSDSRNRLHVIWKLKDATICSDSGGWIKIQPWIPQNDLLADPRILMFISHGGFNSVVESVHHAKPLIIFPITSDQPRNAAAAESKGYAIRMDIADFSSETLTSNINKLLSDPSYKRNADLASAILRDRHDTPAQRVSAIIDHVINYGDQHLRTGALELSAIQFFMFDVFATLVAAASAALLIVVLICRCVCRTCCRRCRSAKNKCKIE